MHERVEKILATGMIERSDGSTLPASSHIPRDECELIYRSIRESKATEAVEVGMAFGISTLCICDALSQNARELGRTARLVGMDPAQNDNAWQGLGLQQARAAGFGELLQFHERSSQDLLPQLVREGHRTQFAFIDGWHTFDHTLVDFFYIDQMLNVGGTVILDDVGYQSINAVARFILSNRSYELIEALQLPAAAPVLGAKRLAKRWLGRLAQTDKSPSDVHQQQFVAIENAHSVALRKLADDERRWDHYQSF